MNKVALRDEAGIGSSTFFELTKNKRTNMEVAGKMCDESDCSIGEIVEYVED